MEWRNFKARRRRDKTILEAKTNHMSQHLFKIRSCGRLIFGGEKTMQILSEKNESRNHY